MSLQRPRIGPCRETRSPPDRTRFGLGEREIEQGKMGRVGGGSHGAERAELALRQPDYEAEIASCIHSKGTIIERSSDPVSHKFLDDIAL